MRVKFIIESFTYRCLIHAWSLAVLAQIYCFSKAAEVQLGCVRWGFADWPRVNCLIAAPLSEWEEFLSARFCEIFLFLWSCRDLIPLFGIPEELFLEIPMIFFIKNNQSLMQLEAQGVFKQRARCCHRLALIFRYSSGSVWLMWLQDMKQTRGDADSLHLWHPVTAPHSDSSSEIDLFFHTCL